MKKLFSILLIVVMMCSMLSMTAFAATTVVSPEYENTDVEPEETSPQTGYSFGIAGVAVIALACGAVALISTKKARK